MFKQMKIAQTELLVVACVIVYVAFFAHPPPKFVQTLLSSPVGHALALAGIVYVVVYQSVVVGIFLGIAYITSTSGVFEYLDEEEQKPKEEEKPQPKSSGVPPPPVMDMLNKAMKKKGDTRLPQTQGKSVTTKPSAVVPPKPKASPKVENFMNF
jgi:hypothetical protein